MDPNKKTRGDDPFQHNWLRLGEIINLAHRATIHSNRHWPPPELWRTRFDDLVTAVKIGELQVPPHRLGFPRRPTIISRQRFLDMYTVIFLEDLWAFAVEQGAFWNWLRDFCRRWASAQGRILADVERPTPKEASKTETAAPSFLVGSACRGLLMKAKIPSGGQRATASSHAKQEFMPMGCVSLSAAVAEVGKHLLGDDWIGDELSALALNIGALRDREIATAIKARQIALLAQQRDHRAVHESLFGLDPEPLPELSKDNLADVEKALAKKWEGEEEARKRLESATAWLGRRLYGTPPDYGDAVPSYIPSWYGELWRLSVGFWNSHSVQEVLFTEVKYHPVDYGEAFPEGANPLKGYVLILQEALREAITRDRAINQTDSGIDATASVEKGAADGSSSHSADNLPDKQPSRVGRPTLDAEIKAAYQGLLEAGEIDFDVPKVRLYEPIRKKVQEHKGNPSLEKGLRDEAIRKVISPLFEADKNKRSASP